MNHEFWMKKALKLAQKAEEQGEVPVGAVLIDEAGTLIAEGWNQPIASCDPSAHAEIVAIRKGGLILQNYRLVNTTLYVTLEPCLMCLGAMIHARIKHLVFGTPDPKTGAIQSAFTLLDSLDSNQRNRFNHTITYESGVLAQESKILLQNFFKSRRSAT